MRQRPRSFRRAALGTLVLATLALMLAPSCAPGFEPPSKVSTLRVLAVTADAPYARAGEEVTLRMTVADGLADPSRPIQVLWVAGCFDPEGDQFFLCFPQFAETLAPLAQLAPGEPPPPELTELVQLDFLPSGSDGEPNALSFSFTMPEDIVSRRPVPAAGPHYGIAFVFFAACAGRLVPTTLTAPGGSDVPDFPLECQNVSGEKLGSDSFVIGYTQVYAFADERPNENPAIEELTLDGAPLPDNPDEAPVVPACAVTAAERREANCGRSEPTDDCAKVILDVVVGDVAEIDPGAVDADGNPLREIVWVSYFVEAGDVSPSLALVSDAVEGPIADHDTEWIPPAEPGLYRVWAVLRDQRGGQSIVRRFIRVE